MKSKLESGRSRFTKLVPWRRVNREGHESTEGCCNRYVANERLTFLPGTFGDHCADMVCLCPWDSDLILMRDNLNRVSRRHTPDEFDSGDSFPTEQFTSTEVVERLPRR